MKLPPVPKIVVDTFYAGIVVLCIVGGFLPFQVFAIPLHLALLKLFGGTATLLFEGVLIGALWATLTIRMNRDRVLE